MAKEQTAPIPRRVEGTTSRIGRDNQFVPSQAVTLIRDAYAAVNNERFAQWAAANLPPDFELVPLSVVAGARFTGPQGVSEFLADLAEAWETIRVDVEELVDFGDRVVALGRIQNRGRGSGIEVDTRGSAPVDCGR